MIGVDLKLNKMSARYSSNQKSLFRKKKELQFGTCSHGETHASPPLQRRVSSFIDRKRKFIDRKRTLGGLL